MNESNASSRRNQMIIASKQDPVEKMRNRPEGNDKNPDAPAVAHSSGA
jgi:hypothetical protein